MRAQSPASDETGDLAVHLELVAPAGCADETDLVRRISRRSRRIRFVPSGPAVREVRAELRVTPRSVTTTLTLRSPGGSGSSSRTVQAQNCDDAVEATALVAAVMLDPTALTAPMEELEATLDAGPPPSASTSAPLPPFPPPPRPPPAPRARPKRESSFEGSVAFGYEFVIGPSPDAMAGPVLWFDLRLNRESVLSPLLRLSVLYVWSDGVSTPSGTADFRLVAPRVDLCPVRIGTATISLYACGMGFLGVLSSGGTIGTSPATDRTRPLAAFGGSLLAPLQLDRVRVTLGAGVGFVPSRDLYAVEDPVTHETRVFHQVDTLAFTGGMGLGVRFP